jgi:hypothetical protein
MDSSAMMHFAKIGLSTELMALPNFFSSPLKPWQALGIFAFRLWNQREGGYLHHSCDLEHIIS